MKYDVLINYCNPNYKKAAWYAFSDFPTYSSVISKFKREIKSIYDFVYVRKRFKNRDGVEVITHFHLVHSLTYTFAHFPKCDDSTNNFLNDYFINSLSSYKLTFEEVREVVNENV